MSNHYFDDQDYNGENYQKSPLLKGDYDNCTFTKCNFKESDLKNINFSECTFTDCDFSMADIGNCSFKEVEFYECKLLGLQFESCNPFLMSLFFKGCTLNFSSFYKLKLSGMKFIRCTLEQVDFTEANLTSVSLATSIEMIPLLLISAKSLVRLSILFAILGVPLDRPAISIADLESIFIFNNFILPGFSVINNSVSLMKVEPQGSSNEIIFFRSNSLASTIEVR